MVIQKGDSEQKVGNCWNAEYGIIHLPGFITKCGLFCLDLSPNVCFHHFEIPQLNMVIAELEDEWMTSKLLGRGMHHRLALQILSMQQASLSAL
jgi:hypothetical protein